MHDLLRRCRNLLSHPPLWWKDTEANRERLIADLDAALENQFNPDWDRTEALQESLREHMAEIHRLRAALAEQERKPLNEDQMNEACIYIWRNLPSDFGHTASEWIDVGVRYAERIHGIK